MDAASVSIDIVSDVVCPWCYVGRQRLERALELAPEIPAAIRWRPFQLDPTIPPEGRDRREHLAAKFGDPARVEEMHARLDEVGREAGIPFRFDRIARSPNTLDAHRLIRWAASAGRPGTQDAVVERLFKLYFEEGADIGDHAVLVGAAGDCGMDASLVTTLLAAGADVVAVEAEIDTARRMGVTGVPCFLLEGRYAVIGAQPAENLADAIRQVAGAKARGELDAPAGG